MVIFVEKEEVAHLIPPLVGTGDFKPVACSGLIHGVVG